MPPSSLERSNTLEQACPSTRPSTPMSVAQHKVIIFLKTLRLYVEIYFFPLSKYECTFVQYVKLFSRIKFPNVKL